MARRLPRALVCLSLLLLQPACDKSRPTAPSTNTPPTPANPTAPTISLELSGPDRIEPGTTV